MNHCRTYPPRWGRNLEKPKPPMSFNARELGTTPWPDRKEPAREVGGLAGEEPEKWDGRHASISNRNDDEVSNSVATIEKCRL